MRIAAGVAFALLLALVAAYAALIGAADWRSDEYFILATYRAYGWPYLLTRVIHWSPRPFSETVFFLYGLGVAAAGRPAIGALLGTLWAGLAAGLLASGRWREPGRAARLLLALAVFAAILAGHEIAGVFFWPAGAVAYLPTLAGMALAVFVVSDARTGSASGEAALAGGLTLAAVSSEAGAIYAVAFAGLRLGARAMLGPRGPRALAWLVLPLLVGGGVLALLARGRAGTFEGIGVASPLLHHPLRGLAPAAWDLLAEFAVPPAKGRHLGLDLLAKALFVAGVWGCWMPSRRAAPPAASDLLAAVLAPLVTAYGLLVTAYYEFGQVCCDRHATLRQALFVLALAALAVGLHRAVAPPLRLRAAAPLLLAAAAAIPAALDGAALRHDFALAPAVVAARRANWGQGLAPGDAMAFHLPPPMRIVRGFQLPAGSYEAGPDTPWPELGIMRFFGKRTLTVLPPP
jgi:hypothetical protein